MDHEEAVKILLACPALDVNSVDNNHATALHLVKMQALAKLLLDRGANPAITDKQVCC